MPNESKPSNAQAIRTYLSSHPRAKPKDVVEALSKDGVQVDARYVSKVKSQKSSRPKKSKAKRVPKKTSGGSGRQAKYPRHNLERSLRIPTAILDQNAGRECTEKESASFVGVTYSRGPYTLEISSALKFGLLERPSTGHIKLTDTARSILRPQDEGARLKGLREAVLRAPEISEVYEHYRGENLPDEGFFDNALVDKFRLPQDKISEFKGIFMDSLRFAQLIEETNDKIRVLDVSGGTDPQIDTEARLKKLGKGISVKAEDTCFVMMPFGG